MFKAKKRNPKKSFRKKDVEEEEDKAEDETSESIAHIKKKRKLLTELQYKKGTDAASLLKGRIEEDPEAPAEDSTAAAAAPAPSSQEGIMEQKHKQALEQYVESKLADMVGDKDANEATSKGKSAGEDNKKKLTKDELYKQLAQSSETMVGRSAQGDDALEGDVGTGGAMLVAGTGLAEVILPVEERLKTVQATQEASGPQSAKPGYGMPKSQIPVPAGVPARFQVSAADRHRHFSDNKTKAVQQQQQQQQQQEEEAAGGNDQDRMGFDALRGKATSGNMANQNNRSSSSNPKDNRNRSSDDKVYGNFLKHHRENQWRGQRG